MTTPSSPERREPSRALRGRERDPGGASVVRAVRRDRMEGGRRAVDRAPLDRQSKGDPRTLP